MIVAGMMLLQLMSKSLQGEFRGLDGNVKL
jgi:hypothetical protein